MSKYCTKKYKIRRKTAQNKTVNAYQLCRINARKNGEKITQQQAADALHISKRQLSAYETGGAPVPDEMVVAMAEYYETPVLVWWHMKHHTVFGKYLPDVPELKTPQDIIFTDIVTKNKHLKTSEKLLDILEDLRVTKDEKEDYDKCIDEILLTSALLYSMGMGAKQVKIEDEAA